MHPKTCQIFLPRVSKLFGAPPIATAAATALGDYSIGTGAVLLAVANGLGLTGAEPSRVEESVVWDLRLNRALAGAGLSICGANLQALLRNPLAEPIVLGVSAGASTGAVCVIILGSGAGSLPLSLGAPSPVRSRPLSWGAPARPHCAGALAQSPQVMILDEPTSHLDVRHRIENLRMVRDLDLTSIVALHDLNLAAMFCDRTVVQYPLNLPPEGRGRTPEPCCPGLRSLKAAPDGAGSHGAETRPHDGGDRRL